MADRYWVGGTGTWDSTAGTKWSATSGGAGGASVPTSADAVFFNAASGTVTVTVATGGGTAQSINCTGFTGTLTGSVALNVSGSVTYVAGMTLGTGLDLNLLATGTLTTGGLTLGNVTITASGGTVTLGSALTIVSTRELTLTAGTLTTSASNFAITVGTFNMSGSGAKTLTLNGSTVSISLSSGIFNYSGSNLTFNAGTSTINLSGSASQVATNSSLTFNNVAFTSTSAGLRSISGANTFNQLSVTAPASAGYVEVSFSSSQTITTLVANGASTVRRLTFRSSSFGIARTLTVGTYATRSNIDFRDITAAGASAPWSGTSIGNCLGNSNITFTAAKTVYWNLSGAQSWTAAGWATTSGGAGSTNNYPLPQDTVIFDNAGAATTITIPNYANIGTINASSRTTSMTLNPAATGYGIYGNFINGTGVTLGPQSLTFAGRGIQTLTTAGATVDSIDSTSTSFTLTLGDALICTDFINLSAGFASFNAVTYAVTASSFVANGSVNLGTASWTITGSGTCWNATNATVTGTAEIILSNNTTTSRTFAGGSETYGKLTIGGATSTSTTLITGTNTFSEIASIKTVAHTIVFPNVTTTVGEFTVRGSAGNLVTLSRSGVSGTFTLAKSGGGVIDTDYLSISNSTASPINTWYAGANSTNGGNNTNWIFTSAPLAAAGNFLSLF